MTHVEATARCAQLNRDERGDRHWLVRHAGPGDWEIASVSIPGFAQRGPLKATVESRPRPSEPPDPRPSIIRNIPPYGPA